MAQEDVSTFLRHVEEIEGIEVFCLANTVVNAEEALLQADALLRDVVVWRCHVRESLFRLDSEAVCGRFRQALHRRRYCVSMPNNSQGAKTMPVNVSLSPTLFLATTLTV